MTTRRIRARKGTSARRKASSKTRVVTKVNYIKGSKGRGKKGIGLYAVTTKKR